MKEMAETQVKYYSIQEYLQFERQAEDKHEFDRGIIRAMGGGSLNHSIIGSNIGTGLNNVIREKELNFISFNSEV